MEDDQDPALEQETDETVTGPQVTEDGAESDESTEESGESEEGAEKGAEAKARAEAQVKPAEAEEVEIVLAGEEPASKESKHASPVIRDLRKRYRDMETKAAQLERELQAVRAPQAVPDPGPEPTLESCDFDADVFKARYGEHLKAKDRKAQADVEAARHVEVARRDIQSRQDAYARSKEALSKQLPDYAGAEAAVIAALSPERQDVLLKATENAALVVAALGTRPAKLKEFAEEMDRDRFAAKIAKFEAGITMKTNKKPQVPSPERPVNGSGNKSGVVDSPLEKLRADAAKTGDNSKVDAYLRDKRRAQREG